ncbi:hypothetical protein Hamer_G013657 [Homarus americanus]|uniref:Uncharacterized protein n=1 Tax=Homarus americanus TaxID=6706 RepID=A0A8J5K4R6_HOMAM|nr:hypothetical protein Hamer_G013657 [Homarus americanus]
MKGRSRVPRAIFFWRPHRSLLNTSFKTSSSVTTPPQSTHKLFLLLMVQWQQTVYWRPRKKLLAGSQITVLEATNTPPEVHLFTHLPGQLATCPLSPTITLVAIMP